jgi:hypothetical protein
MRAMKYALPPITSHSVATDLEDRIRPQFISKCSDIDELYWVSVPESACSTFQVSASAADERNTTSDSASFRFEGCSTSFGYASLEITNRLLSVLDLPLAENFHFCNSGRASDDDVGGYLMSWITPRAGRRL